MTTILLIEDMHCAGCAGSIERTLRGVIGVQDVKVEREAGRAVIEHEAVVGPKELVDRIAGIGFAVRFVER